MKILMKTRKKILAFALLITSLTFAQQKVAVYVTGGTDAGINKVLGDKLVEGFVKSGNYTAVERTSSFLDELSKEQSTQNTVNVKDSAFSRLGRQFGVELVCVAEVSEVLGEKYVSARLIDVENAEVLTTSNSDGASIKSMSDLITLSDKLARELSGKTGKEQHADEQQRISQEQESARKAEEMRKKQQQQEQLGKTIVAVANGVATMLGGNIVLENHDKDPFYVYFNDKYMFTIPGNSTMQQQVPQGYYTVKVVEKSGYVLYQQVETYNVKIEKGDSRICKWD
jgi:hypothetical protein